MRPKRPQAEGHIARHSRTGDCFASADPGMREAMIAVVGPRPLGMSLGPHKRTHHALASLVACLLCGTGVLSAEPLPLERIKLPQGFSIELYARAPEARSLALSPSGVLFVGTRRTGTVYAIEDRDHDGKGETVHSLAEGLNMPNGVAWRDGALYVAEVSRVLRFPEVERRLAAPGNLKPEIVYDRLPTDMSHGWKFIRFGPDGLLYVPVGAPCNECERKDPRYASILRMKTDGSGVEVFAEGWLQGETPWGRPVDVEVARDGSLFVSDDQAGAVYRIRYTAP